MCWYAKINERIALQTRTNELLEALLKSQQEEVPSGVTINKGNSKGMAKKEPGAEIIESVNSERRGGNVITINL